VATPDDALKLVARGVDRKDQAAARRQIAVGNDPSTIRCPCPRSRGHRARGKLPKAEHEAPLMPAQYMHPHSNGQKYDYRDAEAIAEAMQRQQVELVGGCDRASAKL
jgi:hypothetical protein